MNPGALLQVLQRAIFKEELLVLAFTRIFGYWSTCCSQFSSYLLLPQ